MNYFGIPGHLVSIESEEEQAFVTSIVPESWIAANDTKDPEFWAWAAGPERGELLNFTAWDVGQPGVLNEPPYGAHCVRMLSPHLLWTVENCAIALPYLVEFECAPGLEFGPHGCVGMDGPACWYLRSSRASLLRAALRAWRVRRTQRLRLLRHGLRRRRLRHSFARVVATQQLLMSNAAVCTCVNGGVCVAPHTCICNASFTGSDCSVPGAAASTHCSH